MRLLTILLCGMLAGIACNLSDPVDDPVVGANNDPDNNTATNNSATNNTVATNGAALEVRSTIPEPGATDVATDVAVTIVFATEIDASSVTNGAVTLTTPDTDVPATVEVDGASVTLTPEELLQPDTTYVARVGVDVADIDGATLDQPFELEFTTAGAFDVESVAPENGAMGVTTDTPIVITMTQPVDSGSVTDTTFTVTARQPVGGVVGATAPVAITAEGNEVRIAPPAVGWQEFGTEYTVTLSEPFFSASGAPAELPGDFTFRTAFWDAGHAYAIHVAPTSRQSALAYDANAGVAMVGTANTSPDQRSWTFVAADGFVALQNAEAGPDLFLLGGDGNGPAIMSSAPVDADFFEGQLWRPDPLESRADEQMPGESPRLYHLETSAGGPNRTLAAFDENGTMRVRMEAKANAARQMWWFSRL